jgi:hypothetical protein
MIGVSEKQSSASYGVSSNLDTQHHSHDNTQGTEESHTQGKELFFMKEHTAASASPNIPTMPEEKHDQCQKHSPYCNQFS